MDNNKKESNKPVIIQPNAITSARYEYSQMQKDFMYHFLDRMNAYMSKDVAFVKDLFGNVVIEMDLKDIVKSDNYTPMLEAIRDLQKKPIYYNYNRENATYDVSTHLIATLEHKRGSGKIYITTTEASLPVISYIGAGFTAFNKSIALALPSFYAKRLYELCCRWKDKGFCRMTIKEFRKMMMIEDKFKNHNDMAKNVLQRSEKMLSSQADLTFTYTFRKENGSKAFNWLELNIMPVSGEHGNKSGWYQTLYNILYTIYRDGTAFQVCDFIADRDELKKAAERFRRLYKDIESGKIKPHGILAYVSTVLEVEFEVPESVLLSEEKKRKKEEKKRKAQAKLAAIQKAKNMEEVSKKQVDKRTKVQMTQDMFESNTDPDSRTGNAQSLADIIRNKRGS
jgi:hypothetical protein